MTNARWGHVLKLANLSPSENALLSVCGVEEKRKVVFLRVPAGMTFPPSLHGRLEASCRSNGLALKESGKWATVADLHELVMDVEWLWKGWIPKGLLTGLAGQPGVGKTTVGLQFAKTVATGGSWPDGSPQPPRPIVFVETESAQALLVMHCREMQIPMDRVFLPNFEGDMLTQPDLAKPEHREHLLRLCEDIRPGLVIVDSVGGAHSRGEIRTEQMRPLVVFLAGLARDFDCGVLANHHVRKRNKEFENAELSVDDVRGSGVFAAFTRSLLGLSKRNGVLQLEILKSNLAPIGTPLAVKFEKDDKGDVVGVSFAEIQPAQAQPTAVDLCADWLRDTLNTEGKQNAKTMTEWAEGEGHTRSTLFRAMHLLEVSGELVRTGRGKDSKWELFRIESLRPEVPVEPGHVEPMES